MKIRRSIILSVLIVLLLTAAGGLWMRAQQRQYALNRKLIAALVHNDTKHALELVNEGADVNTGLYPPPAPSLKRLVQQLLHRRSPSADDNPTAFMLACGWPGMVEKDGSVWGTVRSDASLVRGMFRHGADVRAKSKADETLLIYSALTGDADTIDLILQHGADVNETNPIGQTALMWAARFKNEAQVEVLLAHGANVNLRDHDGETALYDAVSEMASESLIRRLLDHGADPSIATTDGDTPLTKAQRKKRSNIVALLKRGGK